MTPSNLNLLCAVMLLITLLGVLTRRNLISIFVCLQNSILITLLFARSSSASLLIVVILLGLLSLLFTATCLFIYRHKGTLNLDELRDMRG